MNYLSRPKLLPISLLLGLSVLGYFIFIGLKTFSDKDRVVQVKGLAEMYMTADSAKINLSFSNSGDKLQNIITITKQKKYDIIKYLKQIGFKDSDIIEANPSVTDRGVYYEERWRDGKYVNVKIDRYSFSQNIEIKLNDVKSAEKKASMIELELIQKGLTSKVNTNYSFPKLNSIKPQLIAESTKNARTAGEQFANDSKAKLGKIKTASQGQISIAGRYSYDEEQDEAHKYPYIQKVRVVSTIVFFLE